jgi:hypothetical protein
MLLTEVWEYHHFHRSEETDELIGIQAFWMHPWEQATQIRKDTMAEYPWLIPGGEWAFMTGFKLPMDLQGMLHPKNRESEAYHVLWESKLLEIPREEFWSRNPVHTEWRRILFVTVITNATFEHLSISERLEIVNSLQELVRDLCKMYYDILLEGLMGYNPVKLKTYWYGTSPSGVPLRWHYRDFNSTFDELCEALYIQCRVLRSWNTQAVWGVPRVPLRPLLVRASPPLSGDKLCAIYESLGRSFTPPKPEQVYTLTRGFNPRKQVNPRSVPVPPGFRASYGGKRHLWGNNHAFRLYGSAMKERRLSAEEERVSYAEAFAYADAAISGIG